MRWLAARYHPEWQRGGCGLLSADERANSRVRHCPAAGPEGIIRPVVCPPPLSFPMSESPFLAEIAARLRDDRNAITARWLERIVARVTIPPRAVFPTDDLLDHIPLLIEGIAAFVHDRAEVIPADSVVTHHARALGELRYRQGFSEHEVLKEFEILGGILFSFVSNATDECSSRPHHADVFALGARVFHAVALVQQATTGRFLELAKEKVAEREGRLRAFHRALTHEMRN